VTFHALSLLLRTCKEGLRVASSVTGCNNKPQKSYTVRSYRIQLADLLVDVDSKILFFNNLTKYNSKFITESEQINYRVATAERATYLLFVTFPIQYILGKINIYMFLNDPGQTFD